MSIEIADVMLSAIVDGEVRVNIGDKVDGKGFGASIGYWGVDGFPSRPNPTSAAGAAQAVYLTQGNQRRVIASRDNRFVGPFGDLGEGDRAIVSDCDAGLHLDQSANTIALASDGGARIEAGPSSVTLTFGGCTVTMSDAALTLAFASAAGGPVLSSIVLSATGVAIVTPVPPTVTVNGIALTVP